MKQEEKDVANTFLQTLYRDLRGIFFIFGHKSKEKTIMLICNSRKTYFTVC